jgi:hypothetical protein
VGATIAGLVVAGVIVLVTRSGTSPAPKQAAPHSHRPAWESAPAVAATFLRDSYRPGDTARLVLWSRQDSFTVQVFRLGTGEDGWNRTTMQGAPVSPVASFGATQAHVPVSIPIGNWQSGVYFARLEAGGLTGYAPFVVRPKRLGEEPVLIVEPTYTWQAYNFRDDNDDGRGDTWYDSSSVRTVRLDCPFLARGMPPHFLIYDLAFLQWLGRTGRHPDVISDGDLGAVPGGGVLRRAYRLVVFPGHEEYVTGRMYDTVTRYRDLGGHLMFLSADNFFWRVVRRGDTITRMQRWRDLGRPEAALVGVQFVRNDRGVHQGPWRVESTTRFPWLFAGTGLRLGGRFGFAGVEIDHVAPSSPAGTTVVARIPNLMGRGYTADMTYYETSAGAEVFAAGAFTLAGERDPVSRRVVRNVWDHLEK